MDKKTIIIIILSLIIIVLLARGVTNHVSENTTLYHKVNITSTFSMDVPYSKNVSNQKIDDNYHVINDSQNNILIISYNTKSSSLGDLLIDGSQYFTTQEAYKIGAEQIMLSNHTVWHNRKENNYIAFFSNDKTDDNVIVICHDKDIMAHMIKSVKY